MQICAVLCHEGVCVASFDEYDVKFVYYSFLIYSDGSAPKNFLKEVAKYDGVPYPTMALTSDTV